MRIWIARGLAALITLSLVVLAAGVATLLNRTPPPARGTPPPGAMIFETHIGRIVFDHPGHKALAGVECRSCHHAAIGRQVGDECHLCHAREATGILTAEEAFHRTCVRCHTERDRNQVSAGPHRRCSGCHDEASAAPGARGD